MNWTQISGGVDRLVLIGLTWAVSKGYILPADVVPLATLAVAAVGAAYAVYVNRDTNLAKRAASIPNTTVITTADIAKATPNQNNIISNTENSAVPNPVK
jgi:hypothetical protein